MPFSRSGPPMVRVVLATGVLLSSLAPTLAEPLRRHRPVPRAPTVQAPPVGYVHNSIGYGRFVPGPGGSFGGYPAGSAGAEELMTQQRRKCEAVPEEC